MGIAYSNRPIIKTTIRGDTSAHFRGDLETAILSVGWTKIRSITNGAVYECATPDTRLLQARLLIQDQGTGGTAGAYIIFRAMDHDEVRSGQDHAIIYGASIWEPDRTVTYQVIIGVCQLFLSTVADQRFLFGQSYAFAFGIPALPIVVPTSSCAAGTSTAATDSIWWATSPGGSSIDAANFRTSPRCFQGFDYSFNGIVISATVASGADPSSGMLTLFYLTPTNNIDSIYVHQAIVKYQTLAPFNLDALIGWQSTIYGQLWDAFQRSQNETLDAIQTYDDNGVALTCQVWMSSFYSSLLLIVGGEHAGDGGPRGAVTICNVAY